MAALAGRVALITGGTKGIGKAVAQRFAREGAEVVIAARDGELGAQVAETLVGRVSALSLDVADPRQWSQAVAEVVRRHGKLNILVNSAGITEGATLEDATEENWRRHMSTNLDGAFFGCKAALPLMVEAGEPGAIVNISSLFALRPVPGFVAYCASKAALTTMTQVLALECAAKGYPIRANCVHPGGTLTDMLEKTLVESGADREKALSYYVGIHPMKRMGAPEEVAEACLWLASDASSFTTGASLPVDGGAFIRF